MSLQKKLILTLILLLVPLLAADIYYHYAQYVSQRNEALSTYQEHARDLARNTQLLVYRIVAMEKGMANTLDLAKWSSSTQINKFLEKLVGPESVLTNIALVDSSGHVTHGFPTAHHVSISDREYYKRLKNGEDWVVSDLLVSRIDDTAGFIIATRIESAQGEFLGVVLTRIDEERVRVLLSISEAKNEILLLADRGGNITFASHQTNLDYEQRQIKKDYLLTRPDQPFKYLYNVRLLGKNDLNGVVVPIVDIGWSAGVFISSSTEYYSTYYNIVTDVLTILAIFIVTVIAGTFIIRQLTTSVTELTTAAKKFGSGDFNTVISASHMKEFSALASTMNKMAASIQQRDEELKQAYLRERRISAAFQQSMLPNVPSQIGRIQIATAYYPALQEAELGGDFYDVSVLQDGNISLLVADVSGKGLTAAVHTATAKYAMQGFAFEDSNPASVLQRVSSVLYDNIHTEKFVTAFFAVVNPVDGKLIYANAGHPPPLIRRSDGTMEWLEITSGPPLGVSRQPDYKLYEVQLNSGDVLVSYTDGVIEARSGQQWFGLEGLEHVMNEQDGAGKLVTKIYKAVSDFVEVTLQDDIALLVIKMVDYSADES